MIIEQFDFLLKDGRRATMRSPRVEDSQELINYLVKATGETDFLLATPEECANYTLEYEESFIESAINSNSAYMLVCHVANQIVGTARIDFYTHVKTKHRARVAVAVLRDYWGQGIGSRFFTKMISIAESKPEVTQLELEFIEGNERAKALYEKFGFKVIGYVPNSIKQKDGSLLKEYLMIKEMKR
ncbi:MAG: GNAT family N-acetyltransferase [Bacilli bacterium]|nr:GNAT family N-acetyltransferase [Bacilli bacterium]